MRSPDRGPRYDHLRRTSRAIGYMLFPLDARYSHQVSPHNSLPPKNIAIVGDSMYGDNIDHTRSLAHAIYQEGNGEITVTTHATPEATIADIEQQLNAYSIVRTLVEDPSAPMAIVGAHGNDIARIVLRDIEGLGALASTEDILSERRPSMKIRKLPRMIYLANQAFADYGSDYGKNLLGTITKFNKMRKEYHGPKTPDIRITCTTLGRVDMAPSILYAGVEVPIAKHPLHRRIARATVGAIRWEIGHAVDQHNRTSEAGATVVTPPVTDYDSTGHPTLHALRGMGKFLVNQVIFPNPKEKRIYGGS